MYTKNKIPSYSGLGDFGYDVFNPPDYYQRMITDPSQIPYQLYPGGGYGYGYGYPGGALFGPYPGFSLGSRILSVEDAERIARERQQFMERRAAVTDKPEYKYLTPEGRLTPGLSKVLRAAKAEERKRKKKKEPDVVGQLQKKILITVLLGAIISALLK
jgi:hypothetical protein